MDKFNDNDIRELKDMIRIGIVSSTDIDKMTARIKIEDQGIVTGDLRIVQNQPKIEGIEVEPWFPEVGQWVVCLFKPDGEGDGFILGGV